MVVFFPAFMSSQPSLELWEVLSAMATLRALPSISTLLNPSPASVSRLTNSGRRLRLAPRSHNVKLSSGIPASSNPSGLTQGLSDSNAGQLEHEGERISKGLKSESVREILGGFVAENARELAIGSLVFAFVCLPDEHALALGPGGPLMDEFWDNVRRYGFYFFTVVSGGLYSLAKPLVDLLKNPSTQILVAVVVIGTFYLMYLTVSTMLGLNDFVYQYAQ